MKTRLFFPRTTVVAGLCLLGWAVQGLESHAWSKPLQKPPEPKRYALLVGVNQYQNKGLAEKPLQFAERDVTELGEVLRGQGFQVVTLTGAAATRTGIENARNNLLNNCKATDLVVLAFAGHGVQIDLRDGGKLLRDASGRPRADMYLYPVDAVEGDGSTMISLVRLFDTLRKQGGINLVLVDCYRENPEDVVRRLGRSISGSSTLGRLPWNSSLLMGCRVDQKALEYAKAGGGHGLFFHQVIEGLKGAAASDKGEVTWEQLTAHVRKTVDEQAVAWFPNNKRSQDGTLQQPQAVSNLGARPVLARVQVKKTLADGSTNRPSGAKGQNSAAPFAESLGIKLVKIKPGLFMMGSTDNQIATVLKLYPDKLYPDEKNPVKKATDFAQEQPSHRVEITKAFSLSAHEITVGQFRAFVNDTNYQTEAEKDGKGGNGFDEATDQFVQKPEYTWKDTGFRQSDDHPVVNVSWNDAKSFCEWLTLKEGPGAEYRLPTEAEWEYACRAGTDTLYPTGDDPQQLARVGNVADVTFKQKFPEYTSIKTITASDGYVYTTPVGRYAPNAWGLYDMVGNVSEWCLDGYEAKFYQRSPAKDPRGDDGVLPRVIRGGNWSTGGEFCRSAARNNAIPRHMGLEVGFRVARVPLKD